MGEIELSLDDYREYYKAKKLGDLHLPNGSYKVLLPTLYENLTSWKINDKYLSIDDLVAIIVIGSAVRYPGFTEQPKLRKKYWLFGPALKSTKKVPITPNDVDFLILTRENMTGEKVIPALRENAALDDYGSTNLAIICNKMHIVCRGVNQMLEGIGYRDGTSIPIDSVSDHVLRQGVPLFYNKLELDDLISRSSVKRETPRRVFWNETFWDSKLVGSIK